MPAIFINESMPSMYSWIDDYGHFFNSERIEIPHLLGLGARFDVRLDGNQTVYFNDDILERALEARDSRVYQAQLRTTNRVRDGSRIVQAHTQYGNWATSFIGNSDVELRDPFASFNDIETESEQLEPLVDEGQTIHRDRSPYDDEDNAFTDEVTRRYGDDDDDDRDDEPQTNSRKQQVTAKDFPAHDLPAWDKNEINDVIDKYIKQVEYRLRWIFDREEREGVRRRNVAPFSPDDFRAKAEKAVKAHPLNTETSTFYDWNFGSTDFIMRLESFSLNDKNCLRCHFIYKPNGLEAGYEDRIFTGVYRILNIKWAGNE
jgi:hypothetical protein